MKTQLIMLPNPIIVSDEEIKNKDWCFNMKTNDILQITHKSEISLYNEDKYNFVNKIIAGVEGLPSINWNGLEEVFGWIDVIGVINNIESLFEEAPIDFLGTGNDNRLAEREEREWKKEISINIEKLKKAQSLIEKKFTGEDMQLAYIQGTNDGAQFESMAGDYDSLNDIEEAYNVADSNMEDFIKSLQQPKIFDIKVEFNLECGKIEHSNCDDNAYCNKIQAKITNNSIKIIKKL